MTLGKDRKVYNGDRILQYHIIMLFIPEPSFDSVVEMDYGSVKEDGLYF